MSVSLSKNVKLVRMGLGLAWDCCLDDSDPTVLTERDSALFGRAWLHLGYTMTE